jgi:hypothetical protein
MATRGRKSGAALSVVVGSIDGRPTPPADLTKFQADVWQRTVAAESLDQFRSAALQQLLKEYCRHCEAAHILAEEIEKTKPEWLRTDDGLKRYDKLLIMRDRETKAMGDKATKLRLTNQSRYTPQAAATAAKNTGGSAKPWEMTG